MSDKVDREWLSQVCHNDKLVLWCADNCVSSELDVCGDDWEWIEFVFDDGNNTQSHYLWNDDDGWCDGIDEPAQRMIGALQAELRGVHAELKRLQHVLDPYHGERRLCPVCRDGAAEEVRQLQAELNGLRGATRSCVRCGGDGAIDADFHCATCYRELESANTRLATEYLDRVPEGTGLCYVNAGELILVGTPTVEDHNCDAMGCGQSHVVSRYRLTKEQTDRLLRGELVKVTVK